MKKTLIGLVFVIVMCMSSGCKATDWILEGVLSDVEGWDLSACASKLSVCIELFTDNQDKFIEVQ